MAIFYRTSCQILNGRSLFLLALYGFSFAIFFLFAFLAKYLGNPSYYNLGKIFIFLFGYVLCEITVLRAIRADFESGFFGFLNISGCNPRHYTTPLILICGVVCAPYLALLGLDGWILITSGAILLCAGTHTTKSNLIINIAMQGIVLYLFTQNVTNLPYIALVPLISSLFLLLSIQKMLVLTSKIV